MWISSDFEKKYNMYNATENYFVSSNETPRLYSLHASQVDA